MGTPTKHPQSISLPHCWICSARFIEAGGTEQCHHHHVIPQAFGGTDGPTVSLCDSHHNKLHRIAICLKSEKSYFSVITGEDSAHVQKLLYLANAVHNAELATRNDPNKAASAMVSLDARHKAMIDKLKTINPKLRSREAVLICALESLYARHFVQ